MSNFINIHVLISHSPSCLNRDDMNMQKDAIFGGKRRVKFQVKALNVRCVKVIITHKILVNPVSEQFILHNYVMFFGKNLVNVLTKKSSIRH